ncbi:uncharacterized protein MONOS_8736 [Monocercomonoides exilis]|uniref:uncharacterized protein n=1 Tax=Monocercomonoides exilis TaxID=2049356 RepID=UPI003559E268|nr:hypothetical protein MONOS_8736 [Monocercomonoides exilis]|eukprot:MONOS_8736.1-p1 / transcript=MONOS_8736.1 / gene=MONOS_8736 / organism=Monocercomonoides_exilis_PA203 / gene_product=unspecified product / transcript_product=unspecified product / location=Mono_scaffold00337:22213-22995(-) / protein_length=261 / sequence_SO=supercontig / SO=protein_coding / is_pseudo=false
MAFVTSLPSNPFAESIESREAFFKKGMLVSVVVAVRFGEETKISLPKWALFGQEEENAGEDTTNKELLCRSSRNKPPPKPRVGDPVGAEQQENEHDSILVLQQLPNFINIAPPQLLLARTLHPTNEQFQISTDFSLSVSSIMDKQLPFDRVEFKPEKVVFLRLSSAPSVTVTKAQLTEVLELIVEFNTEATPKRSTLIIPSACKLLKPLHASPSAIMHELSLEIQIAGDEENWIAVSQTDCNFNTPPTTFIKDICKEKVE